MQLIIYTHPAITLMVGYLTFSHSSTIALGILSSRNLSLKSGSKLSAFS
ncbi:uncharacterized protein METZ01_LOCUS431985 [marine metagenome]|uniref:Uncharacterized protein n=1 Tax=marine metagenome TaxID=408172 RepID=A0A382Y8H6_9ZZZZ